MNLSEAFVTAFSALKSNKIRTLLTMLGIIIGVFSVVLLISLVKGVQNYITDQFNSIGSNLVFIMPGRSGINQDPATAFTDNKLKIEFNSLLKSNNVDIIQESVPFLITGKTLTYKNKRFFGSISGSYPEYQTMFNLQLHSGRFYDATEETAGRKVTVIGSGVYKKLFGTRNAIGELLKIDGDSYEVVGVLLPKGQDFDEQIIMPYKTVNESLDVNNISYLAAKLKSDQNIEDSTKKIETTLLTEMKPDDFTVMTQTDLLQSIQSILGIIGLGLGGVAAISLIVGGVGIMNIMLVAVTERIKEIGLRKAVGATPLEIAVQFLLESSILSITGGLIGLILGYLASLAARQFIRTEVPVWTILVSLGFSLAVGVLFGTYPAYKASKKQPIEALRYE